MKKRDLLIIGGAALLGVALASGSSWKPINIVDQLMTDGSYPIRDLSQVDTIVVHHSATSSTAAGSNPEGYAVFHVTVRGWPGIAYHLVIQPDGNVYLTNYLKTQSSHTGTLNPTAIAIALSGNFDQEQFTATQQQALIKAINWVQRQVGRKLKLRGHYQYSSKTCPGINVSSQLDAIAAKTGSIR